MNKSNQELKRFVVCGISAVLVDFLLYSLLINLGLNLSFSKAISFLAGTIYSYFINQKWTFKAVGGFNTFIKFIFVYFISLNINIFTNNILLQFLGEQNFKSLFSAFIVSTLLSAIFNFLLLKTYVFRLRK